GARVRGADVPPYTTPRRARRRAPVRQPRRPARPWRPRSASRRAPARGGSGRRGCLVAVEGWLTLPALPTSLRDSERRFSVTVASAFVVAFFGLGGAQCDAAAGNGTVQIKGTAYAFDNQVPIAGATIRAVGAPGASATSRANGSYGLTVPDEAKVTPYIRA